MGGSDSTTTEDIPLSTRKPHDFAEQTQDVGELTDAERARLIDATTPDKSDSDTTATASDSETEFDWEAEDDALSTRAPNTEANVKRGRRLWKAYMRLSRPLRTFIVAAIGSSILITPLIVFRVRFYSSPAQIQAHVWSLWLAITWAAACATYLIVDLAPLLALAVFRALGHKPERIQITVELTKAVLGWLKLALDVSWAWISLSVIRAVYKPPGSYWTVINRVLEALFSAAILLLVEKVCLQYVAINFHRRALADRIEVNQVALRALDRLQNATPATVRRAHQHRQRGHRMGTGSGTLDSGATSGSGSPVGEKRDEVQLEKALREAKKARKGKRHSNKVATVLVDGLGGAINQIAFKNTNQGGKVVYSANKLARKLFSRLGEGDNLTVDDFLAYFDSVSDAKAAFDVFDKDSNGDISKREMRDAVRRIYKERRALTASLKDVSSVVAKLDAVLLAVALMILIFICLLIFSRKNTIASLVPLATIVLGFSFIFGHSAQTLFESLIFIFSTHVFDVGDLVMIDDSPMFVVEFGLFSTTFRRVDGQTVIAPNALLASSKAVHNLRRSSSMWETTELQVGFDTPLEVLERLKVRLEEYVKDDSTGREWSRVSLHIKQMDNQNAITLVVGMEHRPNWQDWGGRWQRRTEFMRHLKNCLEELDVRYTKPVQPVLLPYAPAPGGGGMGGGLGADVLSPTALSPSFQLRQPSFRLSPGHSRESLSVRRSRDSLGRVGSVRGAQVGRAPSHRSLRPGTDRSVG